MDGPESKYLTLIGFFFFCRFLWLVGCFFFLFDFFFICDEQAKRALIQQHQNSAETPQLGRGLALETEVDLSQQVPAVSSSFIDILRPRSFVFFFSKSTDHPFVQCFFEFYSSFQLASATQIEFELYFF